MVRDPEREKERSIWAKGGAYPSWMKQEDEERERFLDTAVRHIYNPHPHLNVVRHFSSRSPRLEAELVSDAVRIMPSALDQTVSRDAAAVTAGLARLSSEQRQLWLQLVARQFITHFERSPDRAIHPSITHALNAGLTDRQKQELKRQFDLYVALVSRQIRNRHKPRMLDPQEIERLVNQIKQEAISLMQLIAFGYREKGGR